MRIVSSLAPAIASSPSSESESESSDLDSGSASAVESLGASGAVFCCSRPKYIRNWCKSISQTNRNSLDLIYVAYNVPHVLHALLRRWPCTTTFEVNAGLIEAIYRGQVSTPSFRVGKKQEEEASTDGSKAFLLISSSSSQSSHHILGFSGATCTCCAPAPALFFRFFFFSKTSVACFTRRGTVGIPSPSRSIISDTRRPSYSSSSSSIGTMIPDGRNEWKGMSSTPSGTAGKGGNRNIIADSMVSAAADSFSIVLCGTVCWWGVEGKGLRLISEGSLRCAPQRA